MGHGSSTRPEASHDSLVRRAISGTAGNGPAGETFRQQLHVLASAAADQPGKLVGCERKSRIIIDRVPQSRTKPPSNQASEPPHVNSLAPATNLSARILFLPRDRDCKPQLEARHQNLRTCAAPYPIRLSVSMSVMAPVKAPLRSRTKFSRSDSTVLTT